jgi:DNA segregation ATPase FtsK/SpoIIIE, S-DNA-T family
MFHDFNKNISTHFNEMKTAKETRINFYILTSLSFGIILLLSLFDLAGPFGKFVKNMLLSLFGRGSHLVVLSSFLTTFVLLRIQNRKTVSDLFNMQFIYGILVMFTSLLGLLSLLNGIQTVKEVSTDYGGGLVGFILYPGILRFVGPIGAFVVLFALFLFGFFIFSGKNFTQLISDVKGLINNPTKFWDAIPTFGDVFNHSNIDDNYADNIIKDVNKRDSKTENIVKEVFVKDEDIIEVQEKSEQKEEEKVTEYKPEIVDVFVTPTTTPVQTPKPEKKAKANNYVPLKNPNSYKFKGSGGWTLPDINNFDTANAKSLKREDTAKNEQRILATFRNFNIVIKDRDINNELIDPFDVKVGPTVSQYKFIPNDGVKLSRISSLHQDLCLALAAKSLRMQLPIPGEGKVSIEIPNLYPKEVKLRELVETDEYEETTEELPIPIGQGVNGENIYYSLTKAPHLLVAGATGSGKSVWINNMLLSLLYRYSPKELQLILVDMKMVELTLYEAVPHLLANVITESDQAINALKWCVLEMDKRYHLLKLHGKRNITDYNKFLDDTNHLSGEESMPYIVVVIDELGDLMIQAKSEVEPIIARLTAMSRAVGIHLVLGTQRPDVNIVTGLIKTNIPSRICFAVATQIDSRVILDSNGGETLLGRGDGLFKSPRTIQPIRFQGANVTEREVRNLVTELILQANQRPEFKNFNPNVTEPLSGTLNVPGLKKAKGLEIPTDPEGLYEAARDLVIDMQMCSISILTGNLNLDPRQAKRLLEELEGNGIIGGEITGTPLIKGVGGFVA